MVWPEVVISLGLCALSLALNIPCRPEELVIYSAVFTTYWTSDSFPKQYPLFRPPAQWSRVVGVTHNENFRLFQLGGNASSQLKLFAETGKQEILGNGGYDVLDEFLLASIRNGTGRVTSDFIADSNHSKVSLAARIVPSPDWFVGIDSLDLCSEGHWVDTVTVEASPLDAGTDSGFTFTAPNWSTEPQEPIYKITSQYPHHPANSFFYPHLQDLPAIATFQIIKKRSYERHHTQPENVPKPIPLYDLPPKADFLQNDVLPWKHIKKKARKKKRSKAQKLSKKCEVGEWGEWSPCDVPCSSSQRKRIITRHGSLCPPLLQEKTCPCIKHVFNW